MPPLLALDKIILLVVRCAVLKRLLLWFSLFFAGLPAGAGIVWLSGPQRTRFNYYANNLR